MLEITPEAFRAAITEAIQTGKQLEKDRIVDALNQDAVLTTNLDVRLLQRLIEIVEAK